MCFLRLRKQAGVYYSAWSADGLTWYERSHALYAGITPAHFGLMGQNYTGQVGTFSFPYLRYYATGTQFLTGGMRNVYA
jgi:hypothetical protein